MTDREFERFWRDHRLPRALPTEVWVQRGAGAVLVAGMVLALLAVLVLAGRLPSTSVLG